MMENLDFLPERIRLQRQRKKRLLKHVYLGLLLILGVALLGHVRQGLVQTAQAQLDVVNQQYADVQHQVTMRQELEKQIAELHLVKRIDDGLGSCVGPLDLLSEIDRLLPQSVSLMTLDVEAVQLQTPLIKDAKSGSARATGIRSGSKAGTVKRVRLQLSGIAPGDVEVANFIGQLSASPIFEDVNLGYTRPVVIEGCQAREFLASCLIAR